MKKKTVIKLGITLINTVLMLILCKAAEKEEKYIRMPNKNQ